ncbi:hypothetical protein ACFLW5_02200 [Chloroflexota bacterium]
MREGARVCVISGKHKGKTGKALGAYIVQGVCGVQTNELEWQWWVELDEGETGILNVSELEIID